MNVPPNDILEGRQGTLRVNKGNLHHCVSTSGGIVSGDSPGDPRLTRARPDTTCELLAARSTSEEYLLLLAVVFKCLPVLYGAEHIEQRLVAFQRGSVAISAVDSNLQHCQMSDDQVP